MPEHARTFRLPAQSGLGRNAVAQGHTVESFGAKKPPHSRFVHGVFLHAPLQFQRAQNQRHARAWVFSTNIAEQLAKLWRQRTARSTIATWFAHERFESTVAIGVIPALDCRDAKPARVLCPRRTIAMAGKLDQGCVQFAVAKIAACQCTDNLGAEQGYCFGVIAWLE